MYKRQLLEESLALRRALADKWMITNSLNLLGEVCQRQGQVEQANNLYFECLALAHEINDKACIAHILHHLGTLAQSQTQHERAVRLFAVAATMREMTGGLVFHTLVAPAEQESAIATVRAVLSEGMFATRWAEGQALTLEQAIEYALAIPKAPGGVASASEDHPVVSTPSPYTAGLTAREVEVLRLLVQGLTYAQIADTLIISRRTVNSHASTIYSKLGVTSRAAAMRLALDHHLV